MANTFFKTMQDKLNATSLFGATIETIGITVEGQSEVEVPSTVYRQETIQKVLWGQQSKRDKTVLQIPKNSVYVSKTDITGIEKGTTKIRFKLNLGDTVDSNKTVKEIMHEDEGSYILVLG